MNINTFFGANRYEFPIGYAAIVIDACTSLAVKCESHSFSDTSFFCNIPYLSSKRVEACFDELGISYVRRSPVGILPFLLRYKRRYGLIVGLLLFICLTVPSSSFLWNIELKGNERITKDEFFLTLRESGLYLGCYLPGMDVDSIESSALVNNKSISWISVNLSGNTAYVEIREKTDAPKEERVYPYANIVATEDAIITEMQIFSGMASVGKDTFVRKGELLISGVITKEALGTYFTYARGAVYGKSFKEYEIEIPFTYSVLEETGRKKYSFSLCFFDKKICLWPINTFYENFAEIVTVYSVSEGERTLPVCFEKTEYRESDYKVKIRDTAEAVLKAKNELNKLIHSELSDAEILSLNNSFSVTETSVILKSEVWYEREIGQTVEFEIEQ